MKGGAWFVSIGSKVQQLCYKACVFALTSQGESTRSGFVLLFDWVCLQPAAVKEVPCPEQGAVVQVGLQDCNPRNSSSLSPLGKCSLLGGGGISLLHNPLCQRDSAQLQSLVRGLLIKYSLGLCC